MVLAVSLALMWVWLARIPESATLRLVKPKLGVIKAVLEEKLFRRAYAMIFCFFLVFAAVMNFLPFRLIELSPHADEFRIGMAYSGYLMGLLASLNAVNAQKYLGGPQRTMVVGLSVYLLALGALAIPEVPVLLLSIFLFCGAMFLTHSTATGLLNRRAAQHKGIVNGLYVACYYGGGAVGSILPGYVYRGWGWNGFIIVLIVALLIALSLAFSLRSCEGAVD
jgi:YNFM family putative membrane transporter